MNGKDTSAQPPLAVSMTEARRTLGGLSERTLRSLIADGALATVKIGRRRVVLMASIEALLAERSS